MKNLKFLFMLMCWFILHGCGGGSEFSDASADNNQIDSGSETAADTTPEPEPEIQPEPEPEPEPEPAPLPTVDGWLDHTEYLVASDGTYSLGFTSNSQRENISRDTGSKIVFFDDQNGNNDTAEVYWWDGEQIVDSNGSATNPSNGQAYGTDPMLPNENAIQAFKMAVGMRENSDGDIRLRTNNLEFESVAGGYPDWFMFRRGQVHSKFDGMLAGGRSESEPMIVGAYGPLADGRAIFDPEGTFSYGGEIRSSRNPLSGSNKGAAITRLHLVILSLDLNNVLDMYGTHLADSPSGGPVTLYIEDCRWDEASYGISYPPKKTTINRSIFRFIYAVDDYGQAYFTNQYVAQTTMQDTIFYKNGFRSNPKTEPDPVRDVFNRNIYQGGGAQMGHTYRGIISADGGSGGPQMRFGGLMENSLILEAYWFSAADSNKWVNPWMTANNQQGQSAWVRNNVQLVYQYPNPLDPDTDMASDPSAQPGWGYALMNASFGSVVEDNIISGAMQVNDLNINSPGGPGLTAVSDPQAYEDGKIYTLKNNVIRNNIVYQRGSGFDIQLNWDGASDVRFENNVAVATTPVAFTRGANAANLTRSQLAIDGNRFYSNTSSLPSSEIFGADNTLASMDAANDAEMWPDPDRTLKRYITEVIGLQLLDWDDDPFLNEQDKSSRKAASEPYDPTGMKTFMAVATNMRKGGTQVASSGSKPNWQGDYAWDERFTGTAVVNWIRAGFGLDPVE